MALELHDDLYAKVVAVVEYFACCLIKHDIKRILLVWLRFTMERTLTPIQRLKDIFKLIMRNELTLEIDKGHLVLFRDAPLNTHVPISTMSTESKECITALLTKPYLFFHNIDVKAIQYASYSGFRYAATFKATEVWRSFVVTFMAMLMDPDIDNKYLGGRANELLVCFVTDEISNTYSDYIENVTGDGSEWREKKKKFLANLDVMYQELVQSLQIE